MSRLNRWLKALARPFVRRFVYPILDRRISAVIDQRADVADLLHHVPVLLNHASSFAAAQRLVKHDHEALTAWVAELENRLLAVRREVFFEMSERGVTSPAAGDDGTPRIVNPAKLERAGDDVRLNLGCGHIPIEELINVDLRELDGVDIVADVRALPFEANSLSGIHSTHLLEHFPLEDLRRSLLPYWFSLLRPGGRLSAVVPDMETMIAEYVAGRTTFESLRRVTCGDQEYDGNFHFNMFSQRSLCDVLHETGFVDVAIETAGRPSGICFEMEVRATKPARKAAAEHAGTA